MSIILSLLFTLLALRIFFAVLRIGFRITVVLLGFIPLFFIGIVVFSCIFTTFRLMKILLPVAIVAGVVLFVINLIKENREEVSYSYNENI